MQCLHTKLNECEEVHAAANLQLNYAQRIFRMLICAPPNLLELNKMIAELGARVPNQ
jgi:hypothetical protein